MPFNESDERDRLGDALGAALGESPEVAAAYLYGSAAQGRATPLSDIDVAVLLIEGVIETRRGELQRELLNRLADVARGRRLDVRFFDELPLTIRGRVLTDGQVVLDRDPVRRVQEEVRSRMDYHDFQYFEQVGTDEWVRAVRERGRRG